MVKETKFFLAVSR